MPASIFAGTGLPTCGNLALMQPTALLIVLGLVLAGIGFVVIRFAVLSGIFMLVAGVAIIGTSIWLHRNS